MRRMAQRARSRRKECWLLGAAALLALITFLFSAGAMGLLKLPKLRLPETSALFPVDERAALVLRRDDGEYELARWELGLGERWTTVIRSSRGSPPDVTVLADYGLVAVRYANAGPLAPIVEARSLRNGELVWQSGSWTWGRWVQAAGTPQDRRGLTNGHTLVELVGAAQTTVLALNPANGQALWPPLTLGDASTFNRLRDSDLLGGQEGGQIIRIGLEAGDYRTQAGFRASCVVGDVVYGMDASGDLRRARLDGTATDVVWQGLAPDIGADFLYLLACGTRSGRLILELSRDNDLILVALDTETHSVLWVRPLPYSPWSVPMEQETMERRSPDSALFSVDLPRFLFLNLLAPTGADPRRSANLLRIDLDDSRAPVAEAQDARESTLMWREGSRYLLSAYRRDGWSLAVLDGKTGRGQAAVYLDDTLEPQPEHVTAAGNIWIAGPRGLALLEGASLRLLAVEGDPPDIRPAPDALPFPPQ